MFIEIDPSMSSKLTPYLLKRLKGHAEYITHSGTLKDYIYTMNKISNNFMTTENISGDEEETYKKKLGNFQDTMKSGYD